MSRLTLKVAGAQGQGVNSIGDILARGLKRSGYCVLGYREYMSLIIGGHSSYQLDIDTVPMRSPMRELDVVLTLNYQGLSPYLKTSDGLIQGVIREGGFLVHDVPNWKFSASDQETIAQKRITVMYIPIEEMLRKLDAPLVLQNVVFSSFLWKALGQEREVLKGMVRERFAKKEHLIDINMKCVDLGFDYEPEGAQSMQLHLPEPKQEWKDHLLITGNEAIGLGAVHAGVRLFTGYPMTPASSLLAYIAKVQNATGMVIKQAEDEVTAAQIATGAYFMGTRAMTGTSGGGFDLMSETLSMIGITECPMVFVLAQRPGPATGVPTWTAQGDLFLAVHAAHGEFPRCVLSMSDGDDAFHLTAAAHNIAERYQIPVILLTDKYIAECLFCVAPYDTVSYQVDRGNLITDEVQLRALTAADRYRVTENGVSKRWIPGQKAAGYDANSDEHTEDGTVTEASGPVKNMLAKRMRKLETLRNVLPEPELYMIQEGAPRRAALAQGDQQNIDILLIGWGSTKNTVLDVLEGEGMKNVGYLHYMYMWPLKTGKFEELTKKVKRVILMETNFNGQLGFFLEQATTFRFSEKLLKYDGRPFFYEEVRDAILSKSPIVPHQDIVYSSQPSSHPAIQPSSS